MAAEAESVLDTGEGSGGRAQRRGPERQGLEKVRHGRHVFLVFLVYLLTKRFSFALIMIVLCSGAALSCCKLQVKPRDDTVCAVLVGPGCETAVLSCCPHSTTLSLSVSVSVD